MTCAPLEARRPGPRDLPLTPPMFVATDHTGRRTVIPIQSLSSIVVCSFCAAGLRVGSHMRRYADGKTTAAGGYKRERTTQPLVSQSLYPHWQDARQNVNVCERGAGAAFDTRYRE